MLVMQKSSALQMSVLYNAEVVEHYLDNSYINKMPKFRVDGRLRKND